METTEIPTNQWPAFFDQFSRAHRGQPAAVTTEDLALGLQSDGKGLPFIGVSDVSPDQVDESIRIMLGDSSGVHIDHAVEHPSHVRVAEWNDGFSAALQIESDNGRITLVQVGPVEQMMPQAR
jgi:uncharacterized protein DUF5335